MGSIMSLKVIVPTPLRPSLDNQDELTVDFEGTLQEFLLSLAQEYPKVSQYIFDDTNYSTLDPGFADPASGDFTVSNQTIKDKNIGDPRWLSN